MLSVVRPLHRHPYLFRSFAAVSENKGLVQQYTGTSLDWRRMQTYHERGQEEVDTGEEESEGG